MTKGLSLAALLSAALLTIFFAAPAHACLALAMAEPATFRLSSTLSVSTASGTYGGAATLFATLSNGCTPIIGRTVAFTLNGTSVGSATTDSSGTATLFASLGSISAGVYGTGARASFAGDSSYTSSTGSASLTVVPKTLTITATGINKTYDGTTSATVILSDDRVFSDIFTDSYTGASFADGSPGNAKTITVTGISILGPATGNYTYNTSATASANITGTITRALTITATGVNKTYDGNTLASVTLADDRATGDNITVSYTSAGFADKNAGNGKTVTVSGISVSGPDASKYTYSNSGTATANITQRSLVISATGVNKTADGTTAATVILSDNRVSGDVFTDSYASASFATSAPGTGKTVTVTGIATSGVDAGNYTYNTTATATANIVGKVLAVTATGVSRTYDGSAAATVTLSDNRSNGDNITVSYTSASFADKNAGTGKAVSVSGISIGGPDSGQYSSFNTSAAATANIAPRALTITAAAANKVYDRSTSASVTLTDDRVSGDALIYGNYSASFADRNVGAAKTVTVSGILLSGVDPANYTYNSVLTTTADITPATPVLTVTGFNGVYDASAHAAACSARQVGLTSRARRPSDETSGQSLETVSGTCALTYAPGGVAPPVNIGTYAISAAFTSSDPNYTNASGSGSAAIAPASLTVTADSKSIVYGSAPVFSAALSGFAGSDNASVVSGAPAFSSNATLTGGKPNAGSWTITPALGTLSAANYTFGAFNAGTLTVTGGVLTVSASGSTRIYGTANSLNYTITGFVNGDPPTAVTGSPALLTDAAQSSSPGVYAVTATQGTLAASNYTFAFRGGSLTIIQTSTELIVTSILPGYSVTVGGTFTIGFSVAAVPGGAPPSGSVLYAVDGGPPQTAPLSGGSATVTIPGLPAGAHSLTTQYSGDVNYSGTAARSLALQVNSRDTQLTMSVAPAASAPMGEPFAITFSLAGSPAPSGIISYSVDGGATQTVQVSGGSAGITVTGLARGTHTLTYSYNGDRYYLAVSARTATLTVTNALPLVTQVVNGADFKPNVAAGGLATIFGGALAMESVSATEMPLPINLHGTQVLVNGLSAPLSFVSPKQINFQVPYTTLAGQPVQVVVVVDGLSGLPLPTTFLANAPAVFGYHRTPDMYDPIVQHGDGTLVTPDAPAKAGETLTLYATGAGVLNNGPSDGQAAPFSPLATTKETPVVKVGGLAAAVQFSGLAPGFVGVLQINFQLPGTLPAAPGSPASQPLSVTLAGVTSSAVNLWVR